MKVDKKEVKTPSTMGSKRKASLVKKTEVKRARTNGTVAKKKIKVSNRDVESMKTQDKEENSSREYEVETIVGHREKNGKMEYKIHWKGYSKSEDTWEEESNLNCGKLIKEYLHSTNKENTKLKKNNNLEVEEILNHRKRKGIMQYEVLYKGENSNCGTWKNESDLNCNKLIEKYLSQKNNTENTQSVSDDEEWEVEKIIKMDTLKSGKRKFLVRWKGFTSKDDTWEPEQHLHNTQVLKNFLAKEGKVNKSRSGTK